VNHWGDGAKEARVAGSTLKRPFYYLTGKPVPFTDNAGIHATKPQRTNWLATLWISLYRPEKL
jgi:hypothetical protein